MLDEREWLQDQQPHTIALCEETTDDARAALRAHISGDRRRPRRARAERLTRGAALLAGAGAMGVAVALVVTAPASHQTRAGRLDVAQARPRHRGSRALAHHGRKLNLMRVADQIRALENTTGNATLVIRDQSYPGHSDIMGADLYTDSGEYFYAPEQSGLAAQVAAGNNQADGLFAREVAAARNAATTSDLGAARAQMADAPDPSAPITPGTTTMPAGPKGPGGVVSRFDNYLWGDSLDALQAGAADPQVRAGVLRLLATMNDVTVTPSTTDGQSTLTLTAGGPVFGMDDYHERLIISAETGYPVQFTGGSDLSHPEATTSYTVSRVSTDDLTGGAGQ